MSQNTNTNPKSGFISPDHMTPIKCKHCGGDARLMRMAPAGSGLEQRTYECVHCEQQTNLNVSV